MNIFYVSDCCGRVGEKDDQLCHKCGEHCEMVREVIHDDDMSPETQKNLFGSVDF